MENCYDTLTLKDYGICLKFYAGLAEDVQGFGG